MDDLIIERADLQSLPQKYGFTIINWIFWAIWIHLWAPFFSSIVTADGMPPDSEQRRDQQERNQQEVGIFDQLIETLSFPILVMSLGLMLIIWALYNQYYFRFKERRNSASKLGTEEAAAFYKINAAELKSWQNKETLIVAHDDDGNIVSVQNHR